MRIVGSFIPITLEQLARERGVLLSDRSTPCTRTTIAPTPTGFSRATITVWTREAISLPDKGQCIIKILGSEINTASFAMYTFSISVLVQALLIISMSGAADHGNYRKRLLLLFAAVGSVATMLFLPVVPKVYLLGALFAIIANTCFGASFVLLNSFLPLIVRYHPSINQPSQLQPRRSSAFTYPGEDAEDDNQESNLANSTSALLSSPNNHNLLIPEIASPTSTSAELELSTRISSYGIGIGYLAAVLVQIFAVFVLILTGSTTFSFRLVLFLIGLWWFIFTVPAALWLRPRPGPPIPFSSSGKQRRTWLGYIAYAWRGLGRTLLRARHLKDVIFFLVAWFLLSDGIATVSGTAVLFAKTELQMKPAELALINVIVTLFGITGALAWSRLSRYFHLRPSHTIFACICLFEVIPLYGLLGYIPSIRRLGVFGLQQSWEMYPLGALYGFVLGGLSSYCRSLFGELIPPGSEAAFYALYAITDKGSSIFGPAIVGAITDRYGEIRPAFVFLAVLIALPLPLMALVNVERGKRDGKELPRMLEGKNGEEERYREAGDERIFLVDDEDEEASAER